ncbi:MAG: hypothetical protein EP329_19860 [Deltaproteobacteria bacterium]|nr:MAG: hypothetical protein EP329_19860 [Deltaproteobacteria bacterium]
MRALTLLIALDLAVLAVPSALAGEGDPAAPAAEELELAPPIQVASATVPGSPTDPTNVALRTKVTDEEARHWGASLTVETSIGLGTFVSGDQNQSSVATSFSPTFNYELADSLMIAGAFSLTWYQVLDFATPLAEHTVLMSDISLALNHNSIYRHEGSGFNLAGGLAIGLPTSLASQFQNRLFSMRSSLTASIPLGPVRFSYTLGLGKFFNRTATSTVDCDNFDHPDECREGRDANPDFGFESERRGPEVYLPGAGSTSFYVQNNLNVSWSIVEGLNLTLGIAIFNTFGVRSLPDDEFTADNASPGRSHMDRLVSSLALSYQVHKQVGVGASLVTATGRPFGDQGNSLVVFDFSRAPDNITSVNFSVTGSL